MCNISHNSTPAGIGNIGFPAIPSKPLISTEGILIMSVVAVYLEGYSLVVISYYHDDDELCNCHDLPYYYDYDDYDDYDDYHLAIVSLISIRTYSRACVFSAVVTFFFLQFQVTDTSTPLDKINAFDNKQFPSSVRLHWEAGLDYVIATTEYQVYIALHRERIFLFILSFAEGSEGST